ncbi:hypothetical protein BDI4_1120039 [Burkholderia diffusa]|nr:hypothetical protein BDI4_1120039 [Burkholderia diffusa]
MLGRRQYVRLLGVDAGVQRRPDTLSRRGRRGRPARAATDPRAARDALTAPRRPGQFSSIRTRAASLVSMRLSHSHGDT